MGFFTEDPKKPHLIKTSIWGTKTYHDPKTGKKLKDQQKAAKGEKLKKAGWW